MSSNSNDNVTQAEQDAAAPIVDAAARSPATESSTDDSASLSTAAPGPGTSTEPIVLDGSSAPPPASTVVPDMAGRAALTAQIEEAIRKTCAE